MLGSLLSPLVSLASLQLNARGRGPNAWVSPMGCLTFSLLIKPPPGFPPSSLVFIQYLFSLAVVQACRGIMGSVGDKIRLKWPNDIYAVSRDGDGKEVLNKLGGVLVSTNFSGGKVDVVIGESYLLLLSGTYRLMNTLGLGFNVFHERPTSSLVQLLADDDQGDISLERTLAAILTRFDEMWAAFIAVHGSFQPFQQMYLDTWLHSCGLFHVFPTAQLIRICIATKWSQSPP
jgi:biotin---protein ligase